jgi:hypothetical protein
VSGGRESLRAWKYEFYCFCVTLSRACYIVAPLSLIRFVIKSIFFDVVIVNLEYVDGQSSIREFLDGGNQFSLLGFLSGQTGDGRTALNDKFGY